MNKTIWQQAKPHIIAIAVFLLISIFYCLPVFKGMVVNQHDTLGWKGMVQQSIEYKEKYGHMPLWTNSMFSGMPAFQIGIESHHNISIAWLHQVFTLWLPAPANYFFLACIGFYILCMAVRARSLPSVFGALAYAFASYNAVIAAVGHNTKFGAMGYAPAVLAGLILLSQRKYILGFLTTLLFTTLMIWQNHLQITYYTFLMAGLMAIAYAVRTLREKQVKPLLVSLALAAVAVVISVASYAVVLYPTSVYAKESMRGGRSELTAATTGDTTNTNKSKGGLDKEYAFHWSYGIGETMTLVMPAYNGGSEGSQELPMEGKAAEALQESRLPNDVVNYFYSALSSYWGPQPGTSGTVYLGALVCLFFIIGLFVVKSWHKGWIIAASILGIVMAWGSNFAAFNYFLFDHLPFYNKFRAPTTSLVIPQLTFALLAVMALQELFYKEWDKKELLKKLKLAGIATGLVALILLGTYFTADFRSPRDSRLREGIAGTLAQMIGQGQQNQQAIDQGNQIAGSVMSGLVQDRKSLYGSDLLRTLVFLALGAAAVYLVSQKKIKPEYLLASLVVLNLIDLLPVDRRYLNDNSYKEEEEYLSAFTPTRADLQIKQDTGYFRVFDQTAGDPFADSRASYHHNSIGGYLPARLALYDDVITHQLRKGNMGVYNMLNTKYFITANPQDRQPIAQQNPMAAGPVWFVQELKYVDNADAEMKALDSLDYLHTAVLDKREQSKVTAGPQFDSLATIRLVAHQNEALSYESNASTNQFAVFSEVYYPHGWTAYIDGKETPIVRVNYTLRGLSIPAGKHEISFKFAPAAFYTGDTISLVMGILSILLLLGGGWMLWRKSKTSPSHSPVA